MWVCLFLGLCRFTCFCTWSPAPASVCLILCVWQMHTQRTLQREKAATISGKPQICFRIIKHGFFSGSLLQTDIFIFIILFENIDWYKPMYNLLHWDTSYAWWHDGPPNLSQCPSYTLFGVSEAKRPEATFPSISYYVSGLLSCKKCIALV